MNSEAPVGSLQQTFVTIPTTGNRNQLLEKIIDSSGIARERFIIVATKPQISLPPGVTVIEDLDSPNIHRWWNKGIAYAEQQGAKYVAILNDDLSIDDGTLATLVSALEESQSAVASPARAGQDEGIFRGFAFPYREKILGALWVLNLKSAVRPDENYGWYYGDVDLDIQARKSSMGLITKRVFCEHLFAGVGTGQSEVLLNISTRDARLFEERHPWIGRQMVLVGILDSLGKRFSKQRAAPTDS